MRKLLVSPWTEHDIRRLRELRDQGATAVRASAALCRTLASVRIKARMLGIPFPGMRKDRAAQREKEAAVLASRESPAGING